MLEYSYSKGAGYKEFLSQNRSAANMDVVIAKNIRDAVGSIEEVYTKNTEALTSSIKDLKEGMNENFEVVNLNLGQIAGTLDVVNSNLVTGFQALFIKADDINSSLAHINSGIGSLIEIAKTPVKTWATEQFEIARDRVRRALYPEALEALDLAINGHDRNPGDKSDYRFHLLRGIILLGTPGEPESAEIIDLHASEAAFLLAARYARHDYPKESARALIAAGKAAYAAGRLDDAERHYTETLKLEERSGEARYQLARLALQKNKPSDFETHFCWALDMHWSYAIRAAADPLFYEHQKLVDQCIAAARDKIAIETRSTLQPLRLCVEAAEQKQLPQYPIATNFERFISMRRGIEQLFERLDGARLKSVYDLRIQANKIAPEFSHELRSIIEEYISMLRKAEGDIISDAGRQLTPEEKSHKIKIITTIIVKIALPLLAFAGLIAFFIPWVAVALVILVCLTTPALLFNSLDGVRDEANKLRRAQLEQIITGLGSIDSQT